MALVRDEPHFAIKNIGLFKSRSRDDGLWLYYYLTSPVGQAALDTFLTGTSQQFVGLTDLRKVPVIAPSPAAKRKIAGILTAYDDLIETNKRRIALLEKMAEELYREWFVRMRFPGHQNTKFVKGVPEGWELSRIDSLGKVVTGKTPLTSVARYYGGEYPFIKTPDMHGNMFIATTEENLSDEGLASQPSQTLPENCLCVSCIGTGGIVSITTKTSQTNQQINSVCLERESDLEWAYYLLLGLKETIELFGSTGTTMTNLSKGKFSGLKFYLPKEDFRNMFHERVAPVFAQIQSPMCC